MVFERVCFAKGMCFQTSVFLANMVGILNVHFKFYFILNG